MKTILPKARIAPYWIVPPNESTVPVVANATHTGARKVAFARSSGSIWYKAYGSFETETKYFGRIETQIPIPTEMPRSTGIVRREEDELNVFGERFTVEFEEGSVFLVHPQWSLVGVGPNRSSALANLIEEALELAECMRDDSLEQLSDSAIEMRDFVMRIS